MNKIFFISSIRFTLWTLRGLGLLVYLLLLTPWILLEVETEAQSFERIGYLAFTLISAFILSEWYIFKEKKEMLRYLEHFLLCEGGARDKVISLLEGQISLESWIKHSCFQFAKDKTLMTCHIHEWCRWSREMDEHRRNLYGWKPFDSLEWEKSRAALFLLETMCRVVLDRYFSKRDFQRYESCFKAINRASTLADLPQITPRIHFPPL